MYNKLRHDSRLDAMLKTQAHRRVSKLKIKSQENIELIKQFKMRQLESNFLLKALKMQREQEGRVEKEKSMEHINREQWLKMLTTPEEETVKTKLTEELEHRWIVSYYSPLIRKWDFITCILVLYDCFMVPFKNTFGSNIFSEKTNDTMLYVDLCIKLVFAADVVLGFRKAYLNERTGQQVSSPKLIALRYVKFYFWIDLISSIPFDLFIDNGILRYCSLVKVFRLFRFKYIIQFLGLSTQTQGKIRII